MIPLIALSGLYHLRDFVGDYVDLEVYFNSPLAYLTDLDDPWFLDQYRQSQIIYVRAGRLGRCHAGRYTPLQQILESKNIPCWIDIWGHDVNHDWPWWRKMMPYYLGHLNLPGWQEG